MFWISSEVKLELQLRLIKRERCSMNDRTSHRPDLHFSIFASSDASWCVTDFLQRPADTFWNTSEEKMWRVSWSAGPQAPLLTSSPARRFSEAPWWWIHVSSLSSQDHYEQKHLLKEPFRPDQQANSISGKKVNFCPSLSECFHY